MAVQKWQSRILDYLEDEVASAKDPRSKGKALVGDKKGFWRYRVGNHRVICDIDDGDLVILAVTIGHRKNVY
jgi:mRNA interferase RelE/StbE